MRGTLGTLIGLLIIVLGLAGLAGALHQMMTHADPNASLKAAAGLVTFVLTCFVMMYVATRS
jgi:hypothetical protein